MIAHTKLLKLIVDLAVILRTLGVVSPEPIGEVAVSYKDYEDVPLGAAARQVFLPNQQVTDVQHSF